MPRSSKKADGGLGRGNEPSVLILTSLAAGTKHGYALTKDIADFAGVELGPGTLYGAITRLEQRGLIEPTEGDERRRPYRITATGRAALGRRRTRHAHHRRRGRPPPRAAGAQRPAARGGHHGQRGPPLSPTPATRLLRWYPAPWRARYGDELTALFEDTFGGGTIPWRTRIGTARAGLTEHLRASGLAGGGANPDERTRNGSLLVLSGWAFFVIAGSMYAKLNENWSVGTPRSDRWLADAAYLGVQIAAAVGFVIVLAAGFIALPALWRALRTSGWAFVRRPVLQTAMAGGSTVVAGIPVVIWAHHLTTHQRNGGLFVYSAVFVVVSLLIAVFVITSTASIVSLTKRLALSTRSIRRLGQLALAMVGTMAVIMGATILWWVTLADHAPTVLGGRAPADLIVTVSLMAVGMTLAVIGAYRVSGAVTKLGTDH